MFQNNIYGTTSGIVGYGTVKNTNNTSDSSTSSDFKRPKPVFFWTNPEVMKWFQRHGAEYYDLYCSNFEKNAITGRSLIRINEDTLFRMGIQDPEHREQIARIILKLKLKSDMIEMKDLERKANGNFLTNTLPKASSTQNSANNKTFGNYIR